MAKYQTEQIYFGENDTDLLEYLRERDNRSAWAREAMRRQMEEENGDLDRGDTPSEARLRQILKQELVSAFVDFLRA